jgi:Ser-tRNA(Ala) deacylase AlaX
MRPFAATIIHLPLVALDLWQAGDAVALQAAMQRRAGQMRQRCLQGIKAIVDQQERVPAKGDDDRFVLDR